MMETSMEKLRYIMTMVITSGEISTMVSRRDKPVWFLRMVIIIWEENHPYGFVTKSLEFCDRDNVTKVFFYEHGVRHGYYSEIGPLIQFWAI